MGRLGHVGAEAAHPDTLLDPRIGDLHHHLAVPGLDDRTTHHRPEQPERRLDARPSGQRLDRDPVEHHHPRPVVEPTAHLGHERAAGVELVVGGIEQKGRDGIALEDAGERLDLRRARLRHRDAPVLFSDVWPGSRPAAR